MTKTTNQYSPEVRERAVRMVLDNQGLHESRWVAILSISAKIGCSLQTLTALLKKAELDRGELPDVTTDHRPIYLACCVRHLGCGLGSNISNGRRPRPGRGRT